MTSKLWSSFEAGHAEDDRNSLSSVSVYQVFDDFSLSLIKICTGFAKISLSTLPRLLCGQHL